MEKTIPKDIYIKKIATRGSIAVWIVDGEKIRNSLNEEFTNYAQHYRYRFHFIPEYELWIDREAANHEQQFFIDHLLTEWRLMRQGHSYGDALAKADQKELSERKKAGDLKKAKKADGSANMEKIHKKLFFTSDGVAIWLVDGRLVRSVCDIDFTEGGHDKVYAFVPPNEVWIDDDVFPDERPYVLLHELNERSLMANGDSYPRAHYASSDLEWQARHDKKVLEKFFAQRNLSIEKLLLE